MKIRSQFSRAKASPITKDGDEQLLVDFYPRHVRRLRRRISENLGVTQPIATQPIPRLPPPVGPSGSAALSRPPTSPVADMGAGSAQPAAEPAPGAPAAPPAAPPATTGAVAAEALAAAPALPSPPATDKEALAAVQARAQTKRSPAPLLNTPQMLMSAARGGAQSPTAEGDAAAENDGEDEPCE